MEKLTYEFSATKLINRASHVGVVGSGELEILVRPNVDNKLLIEVRTGITGFEDTWKRVIERFAEKHPVAAHIKINDFGATPGVVSIRLEQALEASINEHINK